MCPGCAQAFNATDIRERMAEATHAGVCHVGYWAGATVNNETAVWWDAIKAWKDAP